MSMMMASMKWGKERRKVNSIEWHCEKRTEFGPGTLLLLFFCLFVSARSCLVILRVKAYRIALFT